ncbi:hypothetical protein HOT31_gp145 [Microbacterium phage Hendrix]|uniref:Uncharacterized protein n=1 Tax=Microbacterium phage Hendrix TaxID=2182341 RepID=A0A2U8UUC5_9CAUD|nr:hypothetical protein HOT31_gp145 [Microbacterium phage Hendrix]AWN07815.1 hypothetical protein PBI_HENDRIX_144 [Microbacterium phage Hendrix]
MSNETDTPTASTSTAVVVPSDVLETLQNELRKAKPFPDGTIVRFVFHGIGGDHYHYAALFSGGKWWFTGHGADLEGSGSYRDAGKMKTFPRSASQSDFSAIIMTHGHRISDLELATTFTPVQL